MNQSARTALIKELALQAGFDRVGVAAARAYPDELQGLQSWLEAGYHGEMAWLARNVARRCDPALIVTDAQSVICLATDYDSDAPRSVDVLGQDDGRGWISRYAWGDDYHRVIEKRLKALSRAVNEQVVPSLEGRFRGDSGGTHPWQSRLDFRYYVDHGPVLERQWAVRAGLGWRGRHGLVVDPARGSFFFLAVIITSMALDADEPVPDHCGSCTACVDACPTDAITPERSVDARRCSSYISIEAPGATATANADALHGHVFGCDICQDVCPFNRFSRPSGEPAFAPRPGAVGPRLAELAALDDEAFRSRFRRSAVRRRKPADFRAVANAAASATKRSGKPNATGNPG